MLPKFKIQSTQRTLKTQKDEKHFLKVQVEKCRLIENHIKQNNKQTRKIQFRSSLKFVATLQVTIFGQV